MNYYFILKDQEGRIYTHNQVFITDKLLLKHLVILTKKNITIISMIMV